MTNLALVDDHTLLRNGLAGLLAGIGYNILFEADNGRICLDKIIAGQEPEIILMDINMPVMDGYETTNWLRQHKPRIKVLALSMYDDETSVIRMLKAGAKGYVLKDSHPTELKTALSSIDERGFYYSELVTGKLMNVVNKINEEEEIVTAVSLSDREVEFLKLCCTELTYKAIAGEMNLSPRTIDGYRDDLFRKLNLKTRVGLVMYAIRNNIIHV